MPLVAEIYWAYSADVYKDLHVYSSVGVCSSQYTCRGDQESQSREGFQREGGAGFLDFCSTPAFPAGILNEFTDNYQEKLEVD